MWAHTASPTRVPWRASALELCQGSFDAPSCDAANLCGIVSEVHGLCNESCNPLQQDCPNDLMCMTTETGAVCVPDVSGELGGDGDPCEFSNQCDPGFACIPPQFVPGCAGAGCCAPYCDLSGPDCGGLVCQPAFQDPAPAGLEEVGICVTP